MLSTKNGSGERWSGISSEGREDWFVVVTVTEIEEVEDPRRSELNSLVDISSFGDVLEKRERSGVRGVRRKREREVGDSARRFEERLLTRMRSGRR